MIYSSRPTTDHNIFIMFTFRESGLAEGWEAATTTSTERQSSAREKVKLWVFEKPSLKQWGHSPQPCCSLNYSPTLIHPPCFRGILCRAADRSGPSHHFGSKSINKIKTAFSEGGITFAPDLFCQVSFFYLFFKSTSGKITNWEVDKEFYPEQF